MAKNIIRIDGTAYSMYEAHVSGAIRKQSSGTKKASTSRGKEEAGSITEESADKVTVGKMIDEIGHCYEGFCTEPYEKKEFFGFFG